VLNAIEARAIASAPLERWLLSTLRNDMQRSRQIAQALSLVLPSLLMKSDVKRSVLNAIEARAVASA